MKKEKHNHKPTQVIKVGLFGTLMFAPIFAVLSTCMYVTFNENAKDSYQQTNTADKYIELDSMTQINPGSVYHFESGYEYTSTKGTGPYTITDVQNVVTTYNHPEYIQNANEMYIYAHENQTQLRIKQNGQTQYINLTVYKTSFDVRIETIPQTTTLQAPEEMLHYLKGIRKYDNTLLSNAFYYAVEQIQEQPIFNWVKNTGTYSTVKLVTNGLGTTTQVLPVLVTYWFFITVIYIIIDIIIETIVLITHMITRNN